MKVGDLVRNKRMVHGNPAPPTTPVPAGYTGVVLAVREDTLNNPPLFDYVDVMLSVDGITRFCGNYAEGFFEVVEKK